MEAPRVHTTRRSSSLGPVLLNVLLAFLAASALSACGNDVGPMAPADVPDVAGSWQGSAVDSFDNDQTVRVFLEQDGTQITGTVTSMIFRTGDSFR